jgi:dTDP-glucose 4,6-dehydratase
MNGKTLIWLRLLCQKMDEKLGKEIGTSEKLITYVKDSPGHDLTLCN